MASICGIHRSLHPISEDFRFRYVLQTILVCHRCTNLFDPIDDLNLDTQRDVDPLWLSDASIQVEIDHTLVGSRYIHSRLPKRLRKNLVPEPYGIKPIIGWGIWVDEDFAIPWYIPVFLTIVSTGVFVFAIRYTSENAPKANGWTIGSFLLTPINLIFSAWVLRAKDSKHARM